MQLIKKKKKYTLRSRFNSLARTVGKMPCWNYGQTSGRVKCLKQSELSDLFLYLSFYLSPLLSSFSVKPTYQFTPAATGSSRDLATRHTGLIPIQIYQLACRRGNP